jgi:hypothetical protein
MSFAFEETDTTLYDVIEKAKNKGIVILCSTADQGNNSSQVWPAGYESATIAIAACNSYGNLAPWSSGVAAKYFFQGMDVATERIPYMKSEEHISGSSVATAIAAGVASLILACYRMANPGLDPTAHRGDIVETYFKKMTKDSSTKSSNPVESKYVRPWKVFKKMEAPIDSKWLRNTFPKHQGS